MISPIQVADIFVGQPDGSSRIFKDKRVFQLDYVPGRVLHREEQVNRIKLTLRDLEHGVRAKNILCLGVFGTGKTVVVRSVCRNLSSAPAVAYINCAEENTRVKILRESLRKMKDEPVKSGFPSDFYLQWFKDEVARHKYVILILDEVDKFVEHKDSEFNEMFYTLSRTVDNVVTIMLTNRASFETDFLSALDSRVKDTFYFERIEFGDYYANELMDILEDRAQTGLNPETYDRGTIAMIAKTAYDQGLRARGLIKLARIAGEIAETKGHERIEEQDVKQATEQWTREHDLDIIRRLPPPVRTILAHILVNAPLASAAYEHYRQYALKNGTGESLPQFYMYIKELDTMGLIDKEKHGYGRGRGANMKLTVKPELKTTIAKSLESEPELLPPHPSISDSVTEKTQP